MKKFLGNFSLSRKKTEVGKNRRFFLGFSPKILREGKKNSERIFPGKNFQFFPKGPLRGPLYFLWKFSVSLKRASTTKKSMIFLSVFFSLFWPIRRQNIGFKTRVYYNKRESLNLRFLFKYTINTHKNILERKCLDQNQSVFSTSQLKPLLTVDLTPIKRVIFPRPKWRALILR